MHLEYVRIHVICRVNQAECFIHIYVVAPQEYVNIYSTRRTAWQAWGVRTPHRSSLYNPLATSRYSEIHVARLDESVVERGHDQ